MLVIIRATNIETVAENEINLNKEEKVSTIIAYFV